MSSNRSTTYLIVGIILIGLNAFALAPYVSQATLDTVQERVDSSYDDEEDYTGDESWVESTSQRSYFAYSITNPEEVVGGTAGPELTKMGPFIYNVTVHNEMLEWDEVGRLGHVGQRSDGLVANGSERARASRHGHPAESLLVVPRVEAV